MSLFVKYSCGCIGIRLNEDTCVLIEACDDDLSDEKLCFGYRQHMGDKTYEPIDEMKEQNYVNKIGKYLFLGQRFEAISQLMYQTARPDEWLLRKAAHEDGQCISVAGSPPKEE